MSKRLHTILNEKYRPDTLEGYICKNEIKTKFEEFIKQQDIPHLLFAGKPGAGKTTIAKILTKNIFITYYIKLLYHIQIMLNMFWNINNFFSFF